MAWSSGNRSLAWPGGWPGHGFDRGRSAHRVVLPDFPGQHQPLQSRVGTALYNPVLGFHTGYNANLVHTIAHLPHVRRAENYASVSASPLGANGLPTLAGENANVNVLGSVNGLFFNQDRVTGIEGQWLIRRKPTKSL